MESALVGTETPLQQAAHSFSSGCAKSALSNKVCISLNSHGQLDAVALHVLYSFNEEAKKEGGSRRKRKRCSKQFYREAFMLSCTLITDVQVHSGMLPYTHN